VLALETELAAHGITVTIRVSQRGLEEKGGRWTGRVLGEAMFGEAKARAAKQMARELRTRSAEMLRLRRQLERSLVNGGDRTAAAVNPSNDLAGFARKRGWPILSWKEKENITTRRPDRSGQAL